MKILFFYNEYESSSIRLPRHVYTFGIHKQLETFITFFSPKYDYLFESIVIDSEEYYEKAKEYKEKYSFSLDKNMIGPLLIGEGIQINEKDTIKKERECLFVFDFILSTIDKKKEEFQQMIEIFIQQQMDA